MPTRPSAPPPSSTGRGRSRSAAELGSTHHQHGELASLRHARHRRDPAHHHQAAGAEVRHPRTCRAASTGTRTSRTTSTALRACAEACADGRRDDVGRAASRAATSPTTTARCGCSSTSIIRRWASTSTRATPSRWATIPNITVYRLGKHIKHLHVSDNDGVTNVHWRPGRARSTGWRCSRRSRTSATTASCRSSSRTCRACRAARTRTRRASTATSPRPTSSSPRRSPAMNYLKGICKELGIKVED